MNAPTLFDQELAEEATPQAETLGVRGGQHHPTSSAAFPDPERSPAVRVSDPETCREPSQGRMSAGRWKALTALYVHGPMTDFELADRTGVAQTSIGCRRCDLVKAGLAAKTGGRRPSPTGSPALVWALTDAGREFYINNEGEQ